MGAHNYSITSPGRTAKEAFDLARRLDELETGTDPYTGDIKQATSFTLLNDKPVGRAAACKLIDDNFDSIEKWGAVGCIALRQRNPIDKRERLFVFFGWAAS